MKKIVAIIIFLLTISLVSATTSIKVVDVTEESVEFKINGVTQFEEIELTEPGSYPIYEGSVTHDGNVYPFRVSQVGTSNPYVNIDSDANGNYDQTMGKGSTYELTDPDEAEQVGHIYFTIHGENDIIVELMDGGDVIDDRKVQPGSWGYGTTTMRDVPVGTYDTVVESKGYLVAKKEVSVKRGLTEYVKITLEKDANFVSDEEVTEETYQTTKESDFEIKGNRINNDGGEFVSVVGKNAPTTDVVTAANLAAYIASKEGAEFTGITDENAYEQISYDDLEQISLVIIDGRNKHAIYVKGEETDSYEKAYHKKVEWAVYDYLTKNGFQVTPLVTGEKYEGGLIVWDANYRDPITNIKGGAVRTDAHSYFEVGEKFTKEDLLFEPYENYKKQQNPEPVVVKEEPVPEPVQIAEPEVVEEIKPKTPEEPVKETVESVQEQNVIKRVFSWFRGLFS